MTTQGERRVPMMTGDELELPLGRAHEQTADPVVYVDGRCVGCERVGVHTVPADAGDWTRKSTFADYCGTCGLIAPHIATHTLTRVNDLADRGRVHRGDGGD